MWKTVTSALRVYARRFIAGAVAIALGVGFVAASLVALSSTQASTKQAVGERYAAADLVADAQAGTYRPAAVAKLAEIPGVEAASGSLTTLMELGRDGKPMTTVGVDVLASDDRLQWQRASRGRLPRTPNEVAVVEGASQVEGVRIGDRVRLGAMDSSGEPGAARVVGAVDSSPSAGTAFVATPGLVLPRAAPSGYSDILLRTADGQAEAVRSQAEQVLGRGDVVPSDVRQQRAVEEFTNGRDVLGLVLAGFGAIACFVAAIVIVNTFSIMVAARTRELALQRCIGAKRRQIFGAVVAEATLIATIASAAGIAVGIGLVAAAQSLVADALPIPLTVLEVPLPGLAGAFLVGVVTTLVAAAVPAVRATRVAPLAALRPEPASLLRRRPMLARVAGTLFLLGGGVALALGVIAESLPLGVAGGCASFLGVLLLLTTIAPAAVRLLGASLRRFAVARLAVDGAVRHPGRTAATTAAVLVGVSAIAVLSVGAASMSATTQSSLNSQYPVDLEVDSSDTLPNDFSQKVGEVEGVAAVARLPVATGTVLAGDSRTEGEDLTGVDAAARGALVDPGQLAKLRPGVVMVNKSRAESYGAADGDRIRLRVQGRTQEFTLRVGGSALDGAYLTASDLHRMAPSAPSSMAWVRAGETADAGAVISGVEERLGKISSAELGGSLPLREETEQVVRGMLLVAVGLLAITVLIALVGVGNTLGLSVVERAREHALLRALGLTRRRVRRLLAIEALLMTTVAGLLGVLLGLIYGWSATMTVSAYADLAPVLRIPYGQLAAVLVVAALVGLLASILPARRATTIPPAAGLSAE